MGATARADDRTDETNDAPATDGPDLTPAARGEAPPPGPAIDHPPTRAALARRRLVPLWCALAAVASAAVATGLWAMGASDAVWLFPCAPAAAAVIVGVQRAVRARWMGRILRREPWVARDGRHFVIGPGDYSRGVVVLDADGSAPEVMCTVEEAWVRSLSIVDGPIVVWVAGDPTRRAVATAGTKELAVIAPVRWAWRRRQLQAGIDRRESGDRPDLYHPEGRALFDEQGRRRAGTARRRRDRS